MPDNYSDHALKVDKPGYMSVSNINQWNILYYDLGSNIPSDPSSDTPTCQSIYLLYYKERVKLKTIVT
jgi:hypothetical protein